MARKSSTTATTPAVDPTITTLAAALASGDTAQIEAALQAAGYLPTRRPSATATTEGLDVDLGKSINSQFAAMLADGSRPEIGGSGVRRYMLAVAWTVGYRDNRDGRFKAMSAQLADNATVGGSINFGGFSSTDPITREKFMGKLAGKYIARVQDDGMYRIEPLVKPAVEPTKPAAVKRTRKPAARKTKAAAATVEAVAPISPRQQVLNSLPALAFPQNVTDALRAAIEALPADASEQAVGDAYNDTIATVKLT